MVKDAPWTGHGVGSFEAKYMDYQADYFKEYGSQNRYAMLADNVKQPFNEYLGVLINFGIVGLALLWVWWGRLCIVIGKSYTRKENSSLYFAINRRILFLFLSVYVSFYVDGDISCRSHVDC